MHHMFLKLSLKDILNRFQNSTQELLKLRHSSDKSAKAFSLQHHQWVSWCLKMSTAITVCFLQAKRSWKVLNEQETGNMLPCQKHSTGSIYCAVQSCFMNVSLIRDSVKCSFFTLTYPLFCLFVWFRYQKRRDQAVFLCQWGHLLYL